MTTSIAPTSTKGDRPEPSGIALWWKKNRKIILPPIFGVGGFLLF